MPVYDYLCPNCGPVTAFRPMERYADPLDCPACKAEAPRALLQAPFSTSLSAGAREASERNEKARHVPKFSTASDRADAARERKAKRHPAGCGCCSGVSTGRSGTVYTADGGKVFPSKRPWMISH